MHIVYPFEYAILRAIDDAFRAEMNKELADYQARKDDEREAKAKSGRRR